MGYVVIFFPGDDRVLSSDNDLGLVLIPVADVGSGPFKPRDGKFCGCRKELELYRSGARLLVRSVNPANVTVTHIDFSALRTRV